MVGWLWVCSLPSTGPVSLADAPPVIPWGHRVSVAKCLSASLPTDVDECASANGGCEGPCCNTVGGFYCRCPPGYQLQGDGKTCQGRTCLLLCPGEGQRQSRWWEPGASSS